MFEVGDKIFYPMHGVGIIESIEESDILGEKKLYYKLSMPFRCMQVMIPIENISTIGIRKLSDAHTMDNVLNCFQHEMEETSDNPNHRYRNNMNKLKSGDIYKEAQVIQELTLLSKRKNLGAEEKNMLQQALQFFIDELASVKGIEEDQAAMMLQDVINM